MLDPFKHYDSSETSRSDIYHIHEFWQSTAVLHKRQIHGTRKENIICYVVNAAFSTQCQELPAQMPDLPVKCPLCVYTFLYIYILLLT